MKKLNKNRFPLYGRVVTLESLEGGFWLDNKGRQVVVVGESGHYYLCETADGKDWDGSPSLKTRQKWAKRVSIPKKTVALFNGIEEIYYKAKNLTSK